MKTWEEKCYILRHSEELREGAIEQLEKAQARLITFKHTLRKLLIGIALRSGRITNIFYKDL